jgi:hypothetical protein
MGDVAQIPGQIVHDVIVSITTGEITGFTWVLLMVGFGAAAKWVLDRI